jgi:hypothetical protein
MTEAGMIERHRSGHSSRLKKSCILLLLDIQTVTVLCVYVNKEVFIIAKMV